MQWLQDLFFRLRLDIASMKRMEATRLVSEKRLVVDAQRLLTNMQERSQRNGTEHNLVMGLAIGYGAKELAPFVISLRQAGYTGDVVLLTHGCDKDTIDFLLAHQVRMVPFSAISMMQMSMNSSRMFRYLDWLLEMFFNQPDHAPYGQILLCDVRDVIFQSNPFATDNSARLSFFLESNQTIGACPINSGWMQRAYGADVLKELADSPVSCAGTLIGSADAILEYLIHMVQHIINVEPRHRFSGIDQAIHNYILVKNLVAGSVTVKNEGLVMTVPSTNPTGLKLLPDGKIINPNGSASPILHQYDRDPKITKEIVSKYNKLLSVTNSPSNLA